MRKNFEQQLKKLNNELSQMGALCEEAISNAAKYLVENDDNAKIACIEADNEIDRKESDIEAMCIRLLLRQQPVATDLRQISSALKMISDMERIGDQSSDIAEIAPYVIHADISSKTHITDMAREVIAMVTDSVTSFITQDIKLAVAAIKHDDKVDRLFIKVKNEIMQSMTENKANAEALLDLLMIAKYFERIGDHAENIAEWVIYSINGEHFYK